MNVLAIIGKAASEGLTINLSPAGTLKAIGKPDVVNRWRPLLKQHRAEIINLLAAGKPGGTLKGTRPLPHWCRADCPNLEAVPLPNGGRDTRLRESRYLEAAAIGFDAGLPANKHADRPRLPKWCNPDCDWLHEWDGSYWCYDETDEGSYRQWEVNTMRGCPKKYGTKIKPGGCWHCRYYDGSGTSWPGMCSCPDLGGGAKEIDYKAVNPDRGCKHFVCK